MKPHCNFYAPHNFFYAVENLSIILKSNPACQILPEVRNNINLFSPFHLVRMFWPFFKGRNMTTQRDTETHTQFTSLPGTVSQIIHKVNGGGRGWLSIEISPAIDDMRMSWWQAADRRVNKGSKGRREGEKEMGGQCQSLGLMKSANTLTHWQSSH